MKLRQSWSLVGLFAILVALGIVSAVVLIQQTQPTVPVAGGMTANCSTTFATPTNVTLGGSGQITFSCNSAAPTTNNGAVTTGACSGRTGAQRVNDGIPTAVSQNAWNYCAKYETVLQGGLPSFTVAWNL